MNEWIKASINIDTVDWKGNPITLHDVPALKNKKTKKTKVNTTDVAKAEFTEIAKELKIKDRDIMLFLLLYAKPGPFQRGYLCQKYKLNKMLFYQWKVLEKRGMGEVIPKDDFIAEARGPVPKNLWADLKRLHKSDLVKVEGGEKQKMTVTVELTNNGETIAKELWNKIADPYLATTTVVKEKLFLMAPKAIKDMVHEEYPKYRAKYKYADTEEKMKF